MSLLQIAENKAFLKLHEWIQKNTLSKTVHSIVIKDGTN